MNVFVQPQAGLSRAMDRVARALARYAPPGVSIVTDRDDADLVVLHVIGYPETVKAIEELTAQGKRYAMMQYCLRSTQQPSTAFWLPLWAGAACVWSYYDLEALAIEDGVLVSDRSLDARGVNFYHAPLGVDADVFRPTGDAKRFTITTSGYVPESEGVLEAAAAVAALGGSMFHLGPTDPRYIASHVHCELGISDHQIARRYSESYYVAGLRRAEGFELPAAEGLLCGARPVMFDAPHYRHWFCEWARFIPEGDFNTVQAALVSVFRHGAHPVTDQERAAAAARFDWSTLVAGFWDRLAPKVAAPAPRVEGPKPKLLWIGDAVVSTGFARCTHKTLDAFVKDKWDISVLGLGHNGDPHPYQNQYRIMPAWVPGGDSLGVIRTPAIIDALRPDVVVVQNDPWNIPAYREVVPTTVPLVGAIAVDGKNCRGTALNGLDLGIFWTQFALDEARAGGFDKPGAVVPLGVELDVYQPMDQAEARAALPGVRWPDDAFVVLNVNRNQPRKRLDLAIAYFAEWLKARRYPNVYLFLHIAPTADNAYDLRQLVRYYLPAAEWRGRVMLHEPEMGYGVSEKMLATLYACADVVLSTTQGEGWWLPGMEALACRRAVVAPRWSGLADWAEDGMLLVPCSSTIATAGINSIGGVPDRGETIAALDRLYRDPHLREAYAHRGRVLVERPCYRWSAIGQAFKGHVETCVREFRALAVA